MGSQIETDYDNKLFLPYNRGFNDIRRFGMLDSTNYPLKYFIRYVRRSFILYCLETIYGKSDRLFVWTLQYP